MQKRFPNGTFEPVDPTDCSPNDTQVDTRQCSLQSGNTVGFYEASSWEYSWFTPHDTAHLITMMGGNVSDSLAAYSTHHSLCHTTKAIPTQAHGVIFGTHRRHLSSDWITFSKLAISIPRTSRLSRWVLFSRAPCSEPDSTRENTAC